MNAKMAKAVAVAILVAGMAGCSRETVLDGQIFVARQDRETVRLSATKVYMLPAAAIASQLAMFENQAKSWEQSVLNRLTSIGKETDSITEKLSANARSARTAEYEIEELDLQIAEADSRTSRELARYPKLSQYSKTKMDILIRNIQTNVASLRSKRAELKRAVEKFAEEKATLKAAHDKLGAEIETIRKQMIRPNHVSELFFAVEAAQPVSTVTDADGRFRIPIKLREEPIVFAEAERKVPLRGSENYVWVHRVKSTNAILSNENVSFSWKVEDEKPEI